MGELTATGVVYVFTGFALWVATRRSDVCSIRVQWRRPWWILLRLLILVLTFHGVFSLLAVHPALGFPTVVLFALLVIPFDFSGLLAALFSGVGWLLYEWLFWLPSRRQLVLRNVAPAKLDCTDDVLGAEAIAVSDLKPTGTIALHGRNRSARSDFGYIAKGERVVIRAAGDFELTVRKLDEQVTGQTGDKLV